MRPKLLSFLTSQACVGAALLFCAAAVTFSEVADLRLGTAAAMGPGYFPAILGVLTAFFGILLILEAWQTPKEPVFFGSARPVVFLLGAIVAFAALYPHVGGALAITTMVVISALAEPGRSFTELLGLCVTVVALIWIIFVWALDLQLNMIPTWGQS